MATFYLDFENGNDANDGTTFANRWKSLTNGATAARIAPGDEIRIMGSPAPTSLGQNGVWTSQALQATKNITGATNATPISITCTAHGYNTGDTVVITGVGGNTNANGTWEITSTGTNTFTLDGSAGNANYTSGGTARLRNNTRVMLTTAVTQNIASTGPGRAGWTASANCSYVGNATFFKEHTFSDAITMATAFTTGKAAYYTLPSTLDLSGYQQVSFWLYMSGDELLAGEAELRLCSDTTGDTVVDTVPIPYTPGGRQRAVTWDKGSPLGSSIASISLFINIDLSTTGVVAMMFSNIIACKASSAADSLTLSSFIGKNTTGETFWGIQSINGRRVMLDADTNATPASTSVRGYYGTSETVTTWKRETIKLGPGSTNTVALQVIQDNGTDGSPITFSGGWDRTAMSTQNLETWLDGLNGNGCLLLGASWGVFEKLAGVRATAFIRFVGTGNLASLVAANNCSGSSTSNPVIFFSTSTASNHRLNRLDIDFIAANVCASGGGIVALQGPESRIKINKNMISNSDTCVRVDPSTYGTFYIEGGSGAVVGNNGARTMDFWNGTTYIKNLRFIDNPSSLGLNGGFLYSKNCDYVDSLEIGSHLFGSILYSDKHDQTEGNHKIFVDGGLISAATDQRKTASGISWKMQPTSATRSANLPLSLSLAKVAVAANSLVTVKAWMRRDNSGLTLRLVCKGGQIAGVVNDVTASVTTTNAWEEETITFTPTETGVVEITAEAWGGTTFSGWVDDITISQA